ncbi:MAG: SusC/RagA family TonB-linked outer membrane protein [Macellibacteroides sp.]|uniref:SusC/RagA family TonB-linked outer membrane protein n=1 Tax=Macellibacteroides sp. TaxID=2014584 RepID=UPI003E74A9AC
MFKNLNLLLVGMKSRTSHLHYPLDASRVKWRKCIALCLLAICTMPVFANVLETQVTISVTNASLYEAFEQLRNKYGVSIIYSNNVLNDQQKVTVNTGTVSLNEALNLLLAGQKCSYRIENSQVILIPAEPNTTVAHVSQVTQQKASVKGQVKDANGEALVGVNVTVKGSQTGTVTDLDGNFVLPNTGTDATLIFSYIGFQRKEVRLDGKSTIAVTMVDDAKALSEVVVIGYGTMEKKQVTSSVTSLSAGDLMVGTGGSSIATAMQGKIGGLIISGTGSPNSSNTFQLRGMTSINAGKSPLIVIDGFPGGDIRSLVQEDILSIDVLKDASAGAIYGTRAASGVILITTKNGTNTNGKVKLSYNTELSKKQDYGKLEMLSAEEYVSYNRGTNYGTSTDWYDEMINHENFSQKHHVILEAGTEKAQIYTSFTFDNNEGIAIEDARKDYAGRINASFKLLDDWVEIKTNTYYRQAARNNNRPNFQQALRNNPTRSPYDATSTSGYNVWTNESHDYNTVADSRLNDYYGLDKWFQPEATLKVNIKPVPGLSVQQVVGYENRQWENHVYRSKYHRDEVSNSRKGYAYLGFSKTENITSEGYASYINEFNDHTFNVAAGYSYFENNGESFNMSNYNFTNDLIKYWNIGEGSYLSDGKAGMSSSKNITERLFSLFARVNYSYKDRYMLSGSIRREGSSKFAENKRWANFWALSGGWRISNEAFMENVTWVDDLKIRLGYGVTGNNDFSSTYMANMLGSDTYWMLPDGTWAYSYGKSQNVNPNLGWEEKKEWNLGLDYSLFKNRLYGKIDVYRRKVDGMIYSVKVPQPPFTQGSQYQNIGNMENKGWELEIGGDIVRTKDWTYTSSINLSHNKTKILSLWGDNTYYTAAGFPAPGSPGDALRIEEGTTIGDFYIWKFAGFDETGNFLLYNKDGEVIPAKEKTQSDKQYVGNYMPKLIASWNHTVKYKNWDLGINLRSWIDYDIYNTINMYFGIKNVDDLNVLKAAYGKFDHITGEKQLCDYYLEDGTFLKIDAITLGYEVPIKKYTKLIDRLRVYGTVGNVATITGYSGMNPEVNITGWEGGIEWFDGIYPQVRTYTIGLQLNF